MAFLTDQILATGVTLNDLIHIVITGDTSQNPAGSSYKATIGQVLSNVITGTTTNIYNSDGSLTGNRTVNQGSFDLDFIGDENSRFQTFYTSTINPSDNGGITIDVGSTNISHNDDTNDIYFAASLFPGNSAMNVVVISTSESAGISFNSSEASILHYDGVTTTRGVSANISGVAINQVYYFPNADGTNGQVLKTDGVGITYWDDLGCDCTFSGGTVTGSTTFTGGISANTWTGNTIWTEKIRGKLGPIAINDTDLGNIYFGSTSGVTIDVLNRRIGIKTATPTDELDVSGKTKTTTLQITSGATNGYVLTSDVSGNATWQSSSGGVTIDPYNNVGSTGTTLTWDVSGNSTNYQATLTGNTTLDLTNVRNGDYGTLIVTQDIVGSRTITFGTVNGAGTTHRVTNGGAGTPTLTSNANATDILTFTYNGSTMFWTVGNDYT